MALNNRNTKLVQFKMSEKAHKDLEALRDETGSLTLSEVIRDSLTLYKWIIQKQKQGNKLYSMPEKGGRQKALEVVLPII